METPEFYQTNYYNAPFSSEKRLSLDAKTNDHFVIDDLLDFPNDDGMGGDAAFTDSSATPVDTSCNSSFSTTPAAAAAAAEPYFQAAADIGGARGFGDGSFSNELSVPYDDLAELEWLSTFVDESFSSEDLQKLQLIQGLKARTNEAPQAHQYQFQPETTRSGPMRLSDMSVPAKARSKRSRAAPGNWTSRLLMVSPPSATSPTPSPDAPAMSSSSESDIAATATGGKKSSGKPAVHKKKEVVQESSAAAAGGGGGEGRKCLHCATDKTPQWRTGPLGPKTLCNACGVRFKSGRLVPEYRPAASPTFVLTKHSNSHRKVLELRRQKEMVRTQQHQQQFLHHHHHHHHHHHQTAMVFDVSSNGDDYLIHQHIGPDFRQLIQD